MRLPVTILHIDQDYQVTYWIIRDRCKIISPVTIPQALQLINTIEFDLIVSEPQELAILNSPQQMEALELYENSQD